MSETRTVYRQLAQRLDAIPNGFPATESGVELRLLATMFAPEEAKLASVMRLNREPVADIAARAHVDSQEAYRTLKGLIRYRKEERGLCFGLMPFVVGFYEEQLPRMDREMAELMEQYLQETRGAGIARPEPAVHRVIPVEEAIPFDLEIFPHERATELIESAKSWGVRRCICRVQQQLIGKGCDHGIENCLVFAPVEGLFVNDDVTRAITKEEALRILDETEEEGLVHTTGNYRDGLNYICNCCSCCCGILRSVVEFGIPTAIATSHFHAVVDPDLCIGCGDCIERCQFDALSLPGDLCQVDEVRCVGCGACAIICLADALSLERRIEDETPPLPTDIRDWTAQRADRRGIPLSEVL
ncbi:MAG TPA: 4Fe-4S ferredoxin [Chloroflexi bacterium]|nr:4Fe-4S ferredoxin [Chloroflexota bacterium]